MELGVLKTNTRKQGEKNMIFFLSYQTAWPHHTELWHVFYFEDGFKKMPLSMYAESDIGQETEEREGDYRGRKWSGCRLSADCIARQEIQSPK